MWSRSRLGFLLDPSIHLVAAFVLVFVASASMDYMAQVRAESKKLDAIHARQLERASKYLGSPGVVGVIQ